MDKAQVRYAKGTASAQAIAEHLLACQNDFIPPLNETVDIEGYAQKLADKATTFEAWTDDGLVGLLAAYLNLDTAEAYISNVSVGSDFRGLGLAKSLVGQFLDEARQAGLRLAKLEVSKLNQPARKLYGKLGFIESIAESDKIFMEMKLI
ncbi:GNAT family N-acetyltransferase [Candidatus Falkowbacteria bacterium]|nr:GNAT family N-acetyltransferase [Candidatus Falkowbacteria bacterium]